VVDVCSRSVGGWEFVVEEGICPLRSGGRARVRNCRRCHLMLVLSLSAMGLSLKS